MSDYNRNVAAGGTFAERAIAIDAGLRAHMLRVYNYMTLAVGLSGVVAWFTFNAAVADGRLTPFGQMIFNPVAMIVLLLATLGLVFFINFRIDRLPYTTALSLFLVYAGLLDVTLAPILFVYTGTSV